MSKKKGSRHREKKSRRGGLPEERRGLPREKNGKTTEREEIEQRGVHGKDQVTGKKKKGGGTLP